MATLQYVGRRATEDFDLVYKDYIALVKHSDMSVTEIDDAINGGLAGYATVGYVDSKDAKNATKEYVDGVPAGVNPYGGDAIRLPLSLKNLPNGSCPLDATGRIPSSRINAPLLQDWVRGPWTPPQYFSAIQPITTEQTLYSCPVTDPGYPYKLLVFGHLGVRSNTHAEYGNFYVRAGAATGEIIAGGTGPAESAETVAPTFGEKFDTPVSDGLGENWHATSESGTGGYYTVSGGQAVWVDEGQVDHTMRYRYLGGLSQDYNGTTKTDYQKVRLTIGNTVGETLLLGGGNPQWVRACARMNTAEDQWVGFELTDSTFIMKYCLGGVVTMIPKASGGWVTTGSSFATTPTAGASYDILAGTVGNVRQFYFYRNNVLIGQALDGNNVSALGSGNRGMGWYGHATARGIAPLGGQTTPPSIAELLLTDAPPSVHHVSLVPANIAGTTVRQGSTTLYVRAVRSGTASTQNVLPYKPKLTIFAVPV